MMGLHLIHAAARPDARRALERRGTHDDPCRPLVDMAGLSSMPSGDPVMDAGVAASERKDPDHAGDRG